MLVAVFPVLFCRMESCLDQAGYEFSSARIFSQAGYFPSPMCHHSNCCESFCFSYYTHIMFHVSIFSFFLLCCHLCRCPCENCQGSISRLLCCCSYVFFFRLGRLWRLPAGRTFAADSSSCWWRPCCSPRRRRRWQWRCRPGSRCAFASRS